MEEEQRRMQSSVFDALNEIDRKCLRNVQIKMHQCAIECCKDERNTIETLEKCSNNCSKDVMAARNIVQNELNKWQQRIQRCVEDCSDAVSDKMPSSRDYSNGDGVNKYMKEAEACASQCISKHIKMLPQLTEKIIDNVSNKSSF